MQLPFSVTQFVTVFTEYNAAIWPSQLAAYAGGVAAIVLAFRKSRFSGVAIAGILAAFWAFTGIGYQLLSFAPINPAARIFAAAFVVEAVLLLVAGLRGRLTFAFDGSARSWAGVGLVAWAMVGYPLLGFVFGHGFPNGPVFGLTPCPLAIFTFGMLLLAERPPRYLAIVPVLWAAIGTTAALTLGVREDLTLAGSALVWAGFQVSASLAGRRSRKSAGLATASSTER